MSKIFVSEYRELINLASDVFFNNTQISNIKSIEATFENGAEAFQDEIFVEMLLDYCEKIKCDFTYKINNKTKDVKFKFELREDSKYYFSKTEKGKI